jgi:hypothetical protein
MILRLAHKDSVVPCGGLDSSRNCAMTLYAL